MPPRIAGCGATHTQLRQHVFTYGCDATPLDVPHTNTGWNAERQQRRRSCLHIFTLGKSKRKHLAHNLHVVVWSISLRQLVRLLLTVSDLRSQTTNQVMQSIFHSVHTRITDTPGPPSVLIQSSYNNAAGFVGGEVGGVGQALSTHRNAGAIKWRAVRPDFCVSYLDGL